MHHARPLEKKILTYPVAFVAFAGGLSYTEWGLMITESGGDLPYLEFVYRKPRQLASFLYCFCRVILIHTGFTAALW